mgnify:CR=1 FL=1
MNKQEKVLIERHRQMIDAQDELLTLSTLAKVWSLNSKGQAHKICNELLQAGLVEKLDRRVAAYRPISEHKVCPCCKRRLEKDEQKE